MKGEGDVKRKKQMKMEGKDERRMEVGRDKGINTEG